MLQAIGGGGPDEYLPVPVTTPFPGHNVDDTSGRRRILGVKRAGKNIQLCQATRGHRDTSDLPGIRPSESLIGVAGLLAVTTRTGGEIGVCDINPVKKQLGLVLPAAPDVALECAGRGLNYIVDTGDRQGIIQLLGTDDGPTGREHLVYQRPRRHNHYRFGHCDDSRLKLEIDLSGCLQANPHLNDALWYIADHNGFQRIGADRYIKDKVPPLKVSRGAHCRALDEDADTRQGFACLLIGDLPSNLTRDSSKGCTTDKGKQSRRG